MKTKRFAALFLTLAMLLGISPLSVLASGGDDGGASPQISLISAFIEPDVIEVAIGDTRTEAEIMDSFPDAVSATVNGTAGESVPVTEWSLVYAGTADGAFSTAAQAEFYYEPTLAAGYTLSGEAILPSQKVQVGEALLHAPQPASNPAPESFSFQVTVADDGDALTTDDLVFYIPLSGGSGTNPDSATYGKPYNWSIDWGEGAPEVWYNGVADPGSANLGNPNAFTSDGIPHTYTDAGTYTITITNNATNAGDSTANNEAWLAAFGFEHFPVEDSAGKANEPANKAKVTAILSGFTPLMTRTQAQITSDTAQIHYEWTEAFYGCTNLTSIGPGFSYGWESVKTIGNNFANKMFAVSTSLVSIDDRFTLPQGGELRSIGDHFASDMFAGCTNLQSMGANFNLPQSAVLTEIGNDFAYYIFNGCKKLQSMGANFNLPQSAALASIGDYFASGMFNQCENLQSMGANFTMPQSAALASIGESFAYAMFRGCIGLTSMGANFNLPQSDVLASIGDSFAAQMFSSCTNLESMGANFNLPQSDVLASIGDQFAAGMFQSAGTNLVINEVFRFTQGVPTQGGNSSFEGTFNGAGLAAGQSRSAQSIINGNDAPNAQRNTFTGQDNAFSDYTLIPLNFGGGGGTPGYTVTFISDTGITTTYMPPAQGVVGGSPTGRPATPEATNYTFVGWYTDSALTNKYDFTQNVTGNLDLYAKFEGNPFTLSFDVNGGSGAAADMSVTYDAAIGTLPTPTRTGYTFNGWTIDGQSITSATLWNYDANKTATASWTPNTYTLSFDVNGGSGAAADMSVTYDAAIGTLPTPTKTGYTFTGWMVDGQSITSTTVWNYAANKTATASWTENASSSSGSSSADFPYNPSGTLNTGSSTLPAGTRLEGTGTPVSADTLNKMKQAAVDAGLTGEIIYIADLTLVNTADGTAAQPGANTRIRIDVPGITPQDKAWVLHEKADGSIEKYDAVCFDGYVEFAPTSFSVYSVVVDWASRGTSGTTTVLSPQTGVYA